MVGTCAGIVYGLYLTLSSWVLFHVVTGMTFFADKCHLADLNTTGPVLMRYCQSVRLPHAAPRANPPSPRGGLTSWIAAVPVRTAERIGCQQDTQTGIWHSGMLLLLTCYAPLGGQC